MTPLMRNDLRPIFNSTNSAHAGLLIQRGLTVWDSDSEKPTKKALIKKIESVQADELYLLAFKRWLKATREIKEDKNTFANVGASIDGRLMTGLPLGGTLETGVTTHHTYGVPMIAGSSVKGAVRSYAEKVISDKAVLEALFGADDDENPNAGYLIWYDAWWVPPVTSDYKLSKGESNKPFIADVVTVHHQEYYSGKLKEALDMESPNPTQQLAVQGGFYFVIEGVYAWVQFAKKLLEKALSEQGLGAKSGAGYGYFVPNAKLTQLYFDEIEKVAEEIAGATAGLNDNKVFIYTFKTKLAGLGTNWANNPNMAHQIEIDGEKYWFPEVFKKIETWDNDDQKYALTELFMPNQKSMSNKMKDRIKEFKKKLGLT